MSGLQIDRDIVAGLALARDQLEALVEPDGERCRVGTSDGLPEFGPRCECCGAPLSDETIKDAVRPFLKTWALFPFDAAIAAIHGRETRGERSYLAAVARGEASTGAAPKQKITRRKQRVAAAA